MEILSHRGYWKDFNTESNRRVAFERSFEMRFGTETDLRDCGGKVVISHDVPDGNEMCFEELLEIMNGRNLPLALNIKADGLAERIEDVLRKFQHTNYFTFDMSIPELVYEINNSSLNIFSGYSDACRIIPMVDRVKGVWLDSFKKVWYTGDDILEILDTGKSVCIVSEDLHHRDNSVQWKMIKDAGLHKQNNVMLCTNIPEDADNYFYS